MAGKIPRQIALAALMALYIYCGARNEARLMAVKPLRTTALQDYSIYERALADARAGRDPYRIRTIGSAFLYPPPALLLIQPVAAIPSRVGKAIVITVTDLILIVLIVNGIGRLYGLTARQTWYWYILAVAFGPFLETVHIGQINVISAFGIFLLFNYECTRPWWTGLGLAVATIAKLSPIAFVWYLAVRNKRVAIGWTAAGLVGFALLATAEFGLCPLLRYPGVLADLLRTFPTDVWSQSFAAKAVIVLDSRALHHWPLTHAGLVQLSRHPAFLQRAMSAYLICAVLVSSILTLGSHRDREPLFIICNLAALLASNVLWYHHYLFVLVPWLIWMAWRQLNPLVVSWCVLSLFIIQIDHWWLTRGILTQAFLHASIVMIVAGQLRQRKKQGIGRDSTLRLGAAAC